MRILLKPTQFKRFIFILLQSMLLVLSYSAQVAGSYTVPGSFPTIAAAINTLNTFGVSGPVTINIAAGYTEIAPIGGYKLFQLAGGSATNQVFFQKMGSGANPLITAFVGTATPSSNNIDGVWWFIGADYITIDGIDIVDPNTNSPATMEFGYGLYKLNSSNGCQNNTVKNCTISLNRNNGASPPDVNFIASGSRGIDLSSTIYNQNQVPQTSSTVAPAAGHAYNKFYSNYIKNCHIGISMIGTTASSIDVQNDVGGFSSVTGNTIVNFGGALGSEAYGIRTNAQYDLNVSYNVINNNNGNGSNPLTTLMAVRIGTATATNLTVSHNTILLSSTASTNTIMRGIYNLAGSNTSTVTNTIDINNNIFPSYKYPASFNLSTTFIFSNANAKKLNINNNYIDSVHLASTGTQFILTAGATSLSLNSNTITNVNNVGSNFSSNQIKLINAQANISEITNNVVKNISGYVVDCIYQTFNPFTTITSAISNNSVSNVFGAITAAITSTSNGISTGVCNIFENDIRNFSSKVNAENGMNFIGIGAYNIAANISANTIYSITSTGTSVATSNTGNLKGINLVAPNSIISKNKIYTLETNGVGNIQSVSVSSKNIRIVNNVIGDLKSSRSNNFQGVVGLTIYGDSTHAHVAFNSVLLSNTLNLGNNSGSTVLYLFNYTASLTLNNNIFVNTSVPSGFASTEILYSMLNNSTFYSSSSNRNLFYIGPPQNNRHIARFGGNIYSTMSAFKAGVSPRDAQSVTENPPFITTDGNLPNTLAISPLIGTQIESGAAPFAGVTDDYANMLRNTSTPDIGAWEGNYTLADVSGPAIHYFGFLESPCNVLTGRTFTINIKDTSGVATGSLSPRLYYRVNSSIYSSISGALTAGTISNGVWTFSLAYNANVNDIISYFIVAQDTSNFSNVSITPAFGAHANNVNTVNTFPSPAFTYTIETNPIITVNNGTICSGQVFSISPTGAASYTYSSGTQIVVPSTTSFYTVTGSSTSGCLALNPAVCVVSVIPSPTVSLSSGTTCIGQNFTLVPSGATSYTFLNGGPIVNPSNFSVYYAVGSNAFGCLSNTAAALVTAKAGTLFPSVNKSTICFGEGVVFYVSGSLSHSWTNGVISTVPYYPQATANYVVTGLDLNGCQGSAAISVTVNPLPTVTIEADSKKICEGNIVTLSVTGAAYYLWSVKKFQNPVIQLMPKVTSTFSVVGTNYFGCNSSQKIEIHVDECLGLESYGMMKQLDVFPNPNNGKFSIKTTGIKNKLCVKILNAISQVVFETQLNEEITTVSSDLPEGIYYVLIVENGETLFRKKLIVAQ